MLIWVNPALVDWLSFSIGNLTRADNTLCGLMPPCAPLSSAIAGPLEDRAAVYLGLVCVGSNRVYGLRNTVSALATEEARLEGP